MSTEKEVTIYDIAQQLGLSAATVSRALKDHPAINKNTKKKIQQAAKELGYRHNNFASNLRNKKTFTLGVIVPRLSSYFMSTILAGMELAASKAGYNLIIAQSLESEEKEAQNIQTMFHKRVDGLLISLAATTRSLSHLLPFTSKKIPIVFFDRTENIPDTTSVTIDNFFSAYNITKYLTSKGFKRILHVSGNKLRNVYSERIRGYKQALADAGIKFEEELLFIDDMSEDTGIRAAEKILKMKKKPDAVFSSNDTCAAYCMMHLKTAGVKIPEEIAFAGFNNDPISKVIEPNLTTINYPGFIMGETAVNVLIGYLNEEHITKVTNSVVLRSELVVRQSTEKK
ncbi:MAG: LacI family DNA-binding transcriptional regulator [Sphingobacteriia bacterium]|nr:LacI family DNA-binding transcriptional regulator [Sphingobacteriia bacterium]